MWGASRANGAFIGSFGKVFGLGFRVGLKICFELYRSKESIVLSMSSGNGKDTLDFCHNA